MLASPFVPYSARQRSRVTFVPIRQGRYKMSELVYKYRYFVIKKDVRRAIKTAFKDTTVLRARDLGNLPAWFGSAC
jgi:hypothetical protein